MSIAMPYKTKNIIKSINPSHKITTKDHHHSVSPNMRPIYNPQKPIKNNLFPKSRISQNNNDNRIQINVIHPKKEKEKSRIIEGDLNFNESNKSSKISSNNLRQNNNINKHQKRLPRKSPIPIQRSFVPKKLLNFNKFFGANSKIYYNNNNNNNIIRPKTNSFNRTNNIFQPQQKLNKYNNTSKSFNSLNIKKNDRAHSPILRTGQNKAISLGLKPNTKNRHISKSPILGKRSAFDKPNFKFALMNNNNGLNMQNKVIRKVAPLGNKKMNINNNPYINNKKNIVISDEMYQDDLKFEKRINNIMKPISQQNKNIIMNNNNNHNENINVNNINALKIKNEDNAPKKINNKNSLKPINKNIPKNNNININKINQNNNIESNKDNNKNINNNKDNVKSINIDLNNNINEGFVHEDNTLIKASETKKLTSEIIPKNEEKKNNNIQSQGLTDPLKQNEDQNKKIEQQVPNKVIKKIKDILPYTHVGFDGEEPKENNQDNYFIFKNFADNKDYIYMSVCDGHGIEGHFVSEFIKEVLPYYMSENLKDKNILQDTENVHQIIRGIFIMVNNLLVDNENINSLFSGSTCVSVIYTPERLIVPNIGDSRAVLGRYDFTEKKIKAIDLSRDHKPTEKDEAKRILENDGRIQPFTEEGEFVGPERVWIKEEEVPGLAMTRSFGDRVAATVGVMSEPEIKEFNFDEGDKFMIIASDGIWEFISSQECVEIVDKFYEKGDLKGCCEFLYEESSKRWLKEEEVIDDTTLILVFFE